MKKIFITLVLSMLLMPVAAGAALSTGDYTTNPSFSGSNIPMPAQSPSDTALFGTPSGSGSVGTPSGSGSFGTPSGSGSFGSPSGSGSTGSSDTVFGIKNPLAFDSFCKLANAILNVAVVVLVPVAVLFVVWAGFLLVLARGRPDALREARNNLLNTFIGIGIFLGAFVLILVLTTTLKAFGVDIIGSC